MPAASNTPAAFSWPLYTLDFEASSLENNGYPIEIGVAVWSARDAPIVGWSTLIQPSWRWRWNGQWSARSQAVHGIAQSALDSAPTADWVASALNAITSGRTLWCDGGVYDDLWLRRMFETVGVKPDFRLGDWSQLLLGFPSAERERAKGWLHQTKPRHRAREDAERLLLALAHGVGVAPISQILSDTAFAQYLTGGMWS